MSKRAKKKPGRPRKGSALLERCSVRLSPQEKKLYALAGGGDLSAGIRFALKIAGPPSRWPPLDSYPGYDPTE